MKHLNKIKYVRFGKQFNKLEKQTHLNVTRVKKHSRYYVTYCDIKTTYFPHRATCTYLYIIYM